MITARTTIIVFLSVVTVKTDDQKTRSSDPRPRLGAIYLTVTRERPDPVPVPSSKAGGLDIGVIHLGMVSDGAEALAISGRGLRSVKQGRANAQAKLRKKRARTTPGSRRRKRWNRARHHFATGE